MIGQTTAQLHTPGRRFVQRIWGIPDINTRQKWALVWPVLASLPGSQLRLLDAGCGDGTWTLEIAARRSEWSLVGIDRDATVIRQATAAATALTQRRVQFEATDFLAYGPERPFDALLSVGSAHYSIETGSGPVLFKKFSDWLAPGGCLILYGPRQSSDVPVVKGLPAPFAMRNMFSLQDVSDLCGGAGLEILSLRGVVWGPGTLAKQIGRMAGDSIVGRAIAYPFLLMLLALDRLVPQNAPDAPSASILLVARKLSARSSDR